MSILYTFKTLQASCCQSYKKTFMSDPSLRTSCLRWTLYVYVYVYVYVCVGGATQPHFDPGYVYENVYVWEKCISVSIVLQVRVCARVCSCACAYVYVYVYVGEMQQRLSLGLGICMWMCTCDSVRVCVYSPKTDLKATSLAHDHLQHSSHSLHYWQQSYFPLSLLEGT